MYYTELGMHAYMSLTLASTYVPMRILAYTYEYMTVFTHLTINKDYMNTCIYMHTYECM